MSVSVEHMIICCVGITRLGVMFELLVALSGRRAMEYAERDGWRYQLYGGDHISDIIHLVIYVSMYMLTRRVQKISHRIAVFFTRS